MTEPLSTRQRQEYANRPAGSLAYVRSERTAPKLDAAVVCAAHSYVTFTLFLYGTVSFSKS
jgi:hypothetical protein